MPEVDDPRAARGPGWVSALASTLLAAGCVAPVGELLAPQLALEAPEALELGWIARRTPVEGAFSVTNVGQVAVTLTGAAALPQSGGPGPDPGLLIEPIGPEAPLAPGETAEVRLRVTAGPSADGELRIPLRVTVLGLGPDDPRLPIVELRVRVSRSGLVAEPNPLTIGPVPYLGTGTATVAIRNLRAEPQDVFALRHAEGRARYDEAVTRGRFGALPEVDGAGRLFSLGPGEARTVELAYTAPDRPGEAKEQATWRIGTCPDDACGLRLIVQGLPDDEAPQVGLTPPGVHFGPTPVGEAVERDLRISNLGGRNLVVSDFRFEGPREFQATLPRDSTIPPEDRIVVRVRYQPVDETLDNGELVFVSNDPLAREARVRVTGSGVVLPPCRVEVTPPVLDFGIVDVFESLRREVVIQSVGDEPCLVFDPRIELDPGTDEGTFVLAEGAGSVTLDPRERTSYAVIFAPGRPGQHSGTLVLRTSGGEDIEIPLRGGTPEDVRLSCTPDRTVELGAPVALVAALSRDAVAASYRWRLLSAPPTEDGRPAVAFSPSPESGPMVEVSPQALGTYRIEAEVRTEAGERFTCQTELVAVSTGLRARLTWDGAGDLDLHLHRGAQAPWFGPEDCHFDNLRPLWVAREPAGQGPNPTLDRDDTSGEGPENIRIATPELGVPYTLAVSHFERAAGRTARVVVQCGRASARLDVSSRPFRGRDTGACTQNDFWAIATVTFTAPAQCTVDTIDAYRSTAEACASF